MKVLIYITSNATGKVAEALTPVPPDCSAEIMVEAHHAAVAGASGDFDLVVAIPGMGGYSRVLLPLSQQSQGPKLAVLSLSGMDDQARRASQAFGAPVITELSWDALQAVLAGTYVSESDDDLAHAPTLSMPAVDPAVDPATS